MKTYGNEFPFFYNEFHKLYKFKQIVICNFENMEIKVNPKPKIKIMKKILLLFILPWGIFLSAQTTEEKELENLITSFFNDIFSELETEKIPQYLTPDFVLFEDGEIWDYKTSVEMANQLKAQFNSEENKKHSFRRINSFQFLKTEMEGNTGWIYYENFADFTMDGTSISKMHWLESAFCTKTAEGWKIRFLHSTPVKEKS